MPSPFADALASLTRAFEQAGSRWYLFGAQAAILYGAARLTADVDVTAHLDGAPLRGLTDALIDAGFALRAPDPEFIARTRVVPVVHIASGVPADIVLASPGLEEMFLDRAKVLEVDGIRVPVACAEDVVVMKLLAGRSKDVEDVKAILAARSGELNLLLVRETLHALEDALGQSDLSPALDQALAAARGGPQTAPKRPTPRASPKRKQKR